MYYIIIIIGKYLFCVFEKFTLFIFPSQNPLSAEKYSILLLSFNYRFLQNALRKLYDITRDHVTGTQTKTRTPSPG